MDRIVIRDLLLRGIVGINPEERTKLMETSSENGKEAADAAAKGAT